MKTLIDNYEEIYEKTGNINEQTDSRETMFFAQLIDGRKKVLDIGCAEGKLAVELAKRGHTVYGMDISTIYISRTLKLAQENGVAVHVLKTDIERYDISDFEDHFDTIYFMDVIEHLRNPSKALCNIRRMLADDGVLIINTPNTTSFRKFIGYFLRPKRMINLREKGRCRGLHLQEYDYSMLNQLLAFCGFKIERIVTTSLLSSIFPKLGKNLLVVCRKAEPIDVEEIVKEVVNEISK